MKYRKIGLRMCIISIIMIALCIPNQIQIANAAESEAEVMVVDQNNVKWTEDTTLAVFPKYIDPGDGETEDDDKTKYTFTIYNLADFNVRYVLTVSEINQKDYPIEYKLLDSEGNILENKDWINLKYPLSHTECIKANKQEKLTLVWKFKNTNDDVEDGEYTVKLGVNATQVTETDNPVIPPTPDNPNKPDNGNKDDNNNGDDNNSNNNGSNSNGSQNGNNNTSDNKGNNTNNGSDESKGNDSSNNDQGNSQNNNKNNLNIDNTSNKGTGSTTTNKKKVNTSDITTPVIYVALMILTFGLILLVRGRKENS